MCGECKKCPQTHGGYQVHVTIDAPKDKILEVIGDIELVHITNFYGLSWYDEFITSQNFKDKNEAYYEMINMAANLSKADLKVDRLKVESHPDNNDDFIYTEVHYKTSFSQLCNMHNTLDPKESGKYFFSQNAKGSYFMTRRFFGDSPIDILDFPHRIERVIFDDNLELDFRLSGYKG